jgi:hypothetical protein
VTAPVLDLLTVSRLKAARSCLRYHRLRYLEGYRPAREPDTTRFGSLIHRGLEAWWRATALRTSALEAALDAARSAGEADPFELAKAEVLLIGYDTRWSDQDYEVLGVEVEFRGPLVNPLTGSESRIWQRGGKVDAIVREAGTGRVLVVEHKTSSEDVRQGSEYWRRLRMDGQVTAYFEGARFLGHGVAGCLYDVIAKPTQRPLDVALVDGEGVKIVHNGEGHRVRTKDGKKWRETGDSKLGYVLQTRPETAQEYRNRIAQAVSEDLPAYFQRGEVARLESELREGLLDDWHFAQTLREANRLGRAPRNPDACVRYGRTCEFFDACTGAASLDDETRFTRTDNVHPELTPLGVPAVATPDEREGLEPKEQTA